jgi:hypothetical protein
MISQEELLETINNGGTFTADEEEEDRGPIELKGLNELVQQLSKIAKANEAIAAKQSESIIEVLEKLTVACGQQKINLNPIINMVRELKELAKPKEIEHASYEFNIQRDNRGLMQSVQAIPTSKRLM